VLVKFAYKELKAIVFVRWLLQFNFVNNQVVLVLADIVAELYIRWQLLNSLVWQFVVFERCCGFGLNAHKSVFVMLWNNVIIV
jgi:hypothetical protein